jgi:hypothetical protein
MGFPNSMALPPAIGNAFLTPGALYKFLTVNQKIRYAKRMIRDKVGAHAYCPVAFHTVRRAL